MSLETLPGQLLTPEQAAELAGLEIEQVYKWIVTEDVPFVEAPQRSGDFRLPMHGFLSSLPNLVDLAGDLEVLDIAAKTEGESA
ncbi:MAG TPA: hypothetical protein VF401_04250 [Candidatus Saccharimonadales bacterium]